MSVTAFDLEESTIHEVARSPGNNARNRRKEEKRKASPYAGGASPVNARQAWLSAMTQGQGFHNVPSSGYGMKEPMPPSPKAKPRVTNPASHLDKEEMYDEIQSLKAVVASYKKEKSLRKTQIAKLEKELGKKDKLIEDTYSQAQSSYGPPSERSFAHTAIENNSTITGLRQKCHKFECLLKEKETEIKTLKSDLRSTRLQELEIMCDTYYHEITRLTQVIDQKNELSRGATAPRTSSPILGSQRERILEAKIQALEVDNNTLRKQITKTRKVSIGDNAGLLSEFAKLSRADLEEQHLQVSKELKVANELIEELKTQSVAAEESVKQLTSKQTKQTESMEKLVEDKARLEQNLSTIDGEHQAQKLVIKRLNKTVRQHEQEIEKLQKQLEKEQATFKERMSQRTKLITDLENEVDDLKAQKSKRDAAAKDLPAKTQKDTAVKTPDEPPVIEEVTVKSVSSKPPEMKSPKTGVSIKRKLSNVKDKIEAKIETAAEKRKSKAEDDKKAEGEKVEIVSNKKAEESEKSDKNEEKAAAPKKKGADEKNTKDVGSVGKKDTKTDDDVTQEDKENSDPSVPKTEQRERESKRKNVKLSEDQQKKEKEEVAAKKIQKNFRNYSLAKSVSVIQKILRGHSFRSKVTKEEENESAEVIQAALRGLSLKNHHIKSLNSLNSDENVKKPKSESLKPGRAADEKSNAPAGKEKSVKVGESSKEEQPQSTDEDDLVMM